MITTSELKARVEKEVGTEICPVFFQKGGSCRRGSFWAWIREKKLPAIRIGKGYRIRPEDLEAFEAARKTK